jgi:photosystem II stability/assembly factor-like uncharacterized protein
MMMRSRRFGAGLFLGVCLLLSACGGGSNDSEAPPEPTALPASVAITSGASVEAGTPVQFTSDVADPPAGLQFQWDFGDGTSSAEASPSHRFNAPGDYQVTVTLGNEAGETRSASQAVSVRRFSVVQGLPCAQAEAGWCWQNPQPTGNTIYDIRFVDGQTGWAVGQAGQILKTVDAGASWSAQVSDVTTVLSNVRFASSTVGWAVGNSGVVVRTEDGGLTWTRQAGSTNADFGSATLEVLDEQRAIVSPGYYGSARYTLDGGQSWLDASLRPDQVTADGTLWLNEGSSLFKAADLGAQPSVVSLSEVAAGRYVRQFSMGDEAHGLAALDDYTGVPHLRRTVDGGDTWTAVPATGLPQVPDYLKQFGPSVAWALAGGQLFRSTDAGQSWRPVSVPSDVDRYGLYQVTAYDAKTLGFIHDGGYYVTVDGGASWAMFRVDSERGSFVPIQLRASLAGWWLSYGDRVYRSVDGGAHWTQSLGGAQEESSALLSAVWFFDSRRGLAAGRDGWLMQTEDGGKHWERKTLTGEHTYSDPRLQFHSSALGWMSGHWGMSKSTDGGATWMTPLTDARLAGVLDFHFVDAHDGWAVAPDGSIFHSGDGGDSWNWLSSLPNTRAIRFIDAQVGVTVSDGGRVYRTVDGGVTWSERPAGEYMYPERITFSDANTGWIIGSNGSVMVSRDAGWTWSDLATPTQVTLHDVRFADPLHGWIVGDEGLVMSTSDGGVSWSVQASSASRSLRGAFFLDAYTGWIVGEGNSVMATATGGR